MNALHRTKEYHCTVCAYAATTEVRMLDHIRTHATKKYECATCEVKLATQAALQKHTLLYLSKEEIECDICHKVYTSKLVLSIHKHGKHSQGYQCPCYDASFDALIKKAQHMWKCKFEGSKQGDPPPPPQGSQDDTAV